MATSKIPPVALAAGGCLLSLAALSPPTGAFVVTPAPGAAAKKFSAGLHLYQEDGAPMYPSSPLANATAAAPVDSGGNDELDVVGAGTLGDIMAGSGSKDDVASHPNRPITVVDGLVTKEGGELNARFGCDFTPMERIALTANGNLQRIFSSYYDCAVHVHVDSCTRRRRVPANQNGDGGAPRMMGFNHSGVDFDPVSQRPDVINGDATWDRVVHIQVHNRTICTATSIISVASPLCIRLVEEGTVGLGQMFRYLNKLPRFSLLDAGRADGADEDNEFRGGMWRTYELQCEEMTCLIHEEFHRDAWNII